MYVVPTGLNITYRFLPWVYTYGYYFFVLRFAIERATGSFFTPTGLLLEVP